MERMTGGRDITAPASIVLRTGWSTYAIWVAMYVMIMAVGVTGLLSRTPTLTALDFVEDPKKWPSMGLVTGAFAAILAWVSQFIPAALSADVRPSASSDRADTIRVVDQKVPSILAGGDNSLVAVPHQ